MNYIYFTFLVIFSFSVQAQNVDVDQYLILNLISENILTIQEKDTDRKIYNPELISVTKDEIGSYLIDIVFYKFEIGKSSILTTSTDYDIHFNSSSCQSYTFAYNLNNGNFYKLSGFNSNDLLFLLKDLKLIYHDMSIRRILQDLDEVNEHLNLKKIYKALHRLDFDSEYLKSCSEPILSHGKV